MAETVENIITELAKTIKASQMYGMEHPSFKAFFVPFYQRLTEYLNHNSELRLQIERFTLLHQDRVIYKETEKELSIAFRLFRDGIRNIAFTNGLTRDELLLFLDIIGKQSKDEDIALNLWEADFSHIEFYVVEEEEEPFQYKIPEAPIENINYDEIVQNILQREKLDLSTKLDIELSNTELSHLKNEILNYEKESILGPAVSTLTNFLQTEHSQDIIKGLTELTEYCLNNHDFYNAGTIVQRIEELTGKNIIERFENETLIMGFKDVIDTLDEKLFNEFIGFIGLYSKKTIPHLLKLLTQIKNPERLNALRYRIAYIAQNDPNPLLNFLSSKNEDILVNAISILGIMDATTALPYFESLINHPSIRVRTTLITTLTKLNKPQLIASLLDDPELDVRVKSLRALSQIKYPKIYPTLIMRIKSKEFQRYEFIEQKEIFNCLVANGNIQTIKFLKKILFRWKLFGRKKYRVMRRLAAMALTRINSPEALKVLEKGIRKRNRDIRDACQLALCQK
ncbi:hypothetical protein BXT86_03510 [candidate division WOR-3 bacterium 4484_100]|uniref:HEAT repeat domain-containing protein n=1 Tax=candidate division WOR-3 bacterium 4484_100 TaxID=1936077 RepID=A0A1V4QF50_UNCW3|nr:MAG: hypothetical protein BXT86_03510 [candidate division WOR-3 bacterium 4484_100]